MPFREFDRNIDLEARRRISDNLLVERYFFPSLIWGAETARKSCDQNLVTEKAEG